MQRIILVILLTYTPLISQTVWLDQLDLSAMECGWGTPRANRSIDGNRLTIAGQQFDRGIGTHAVSTLLLNLGGKGKRLTASIGVDRETGSSKASIAFYVLGDRKLLWESGVMHIDDHARKIDIDISNIQAMGLLVTGTSDGIDYDHADWCDAKIEFSGPPPELVKKMGEAKPYILTPAVSDKPKITGSKMFGVRPGNPVVFTVAATGKYPMTFRAKNLPAGLSLDPSAGKITGTIEERGEYRVTLTASNEYGEAQGDLRIRADSQICLTPPMGWNSWNCLGGSVSAE